jgi:hypothetical protein
MKEGVEGGLINQSCGKAELRGDLNLEPDVRKGEGGGAAWREGEGINSMIPFVRG